MIFRTYTKRGQILLDSQTPVFALTKTAHLTRLLETPFDQNKRAFWYRAKRLGVNSKLRQGWANIYTKEYCIYYADVPSVMTPITTISYDGNADGCEPIVFLNAGQFDGKTRLMFYSNGRLSDEQLANYRIHVFDINVQRQTQVGINLYDKQGNVTFSNHSRLLNMDTHTITNHRPFISAKEAKELLDIYRAIELGQAGADFKAERRLELEAEFEYWQGEIRRILREKSKEDGFTQNGFIKVGQGYLNTSIKGVAGFSVDDMIIIKAQAFRGFKGISLLHEMAKQDWVNYSFIKHTQKMACIGCRDGLFVCPTWDFDNIKTDGSKKGTHVIGTTKNHTTHVRYTHI